VIALRGSEILHDKKFPSSRQMKWILAIFCLYFGLRLLFFAFFISPYIPPDEVTHLGMAKIFSKVLLFPENSAETFQHGLVTNISWLYYWVMGKLLPLNVFGMSDLLFLRLLNIPFAFGTVYFSWRLLRFLTDDRLTQLLLVVVMTNTLMFSFLSASVSYDNLVNLLAVMSIYYLFAFFKERSVGFLVISFLCQLAGCLTKVSFLPLSLILVVLWVLCEVKGVRSLPVAVKRYYREKGWRAYVLSFAVLAGLLLNIQLYGGNYLQYGKLRPMMSDVLSLDIALEHRIAARDTIVEYFKDGTLNYQQAMRMTRFVPHEGDRADAAYLIQGLADHRANGYEVLGPVAYIVPWTEYIAASTFGIKAHLSIINKGLTIVPVAVLMLLALLGFVVHWRRGNQVRIAAYLALLCGAYAILLMYVHNYQVYLYYENLSMGLQGRYVFPVIGAFYVWFSYSLMRLFRRESLRLGLAIAAAFVFVALDFPFFLYHATRNWFGMLPPFF
jgi:hypothetical protein